LLLGSVRKDFMQDISAAASVFIWRTVLIAPLLAFLVFFAIRKIRTRIQLSVSLLLILLLCLSLLLFLFDLRFTNAWGSIYWLASGYFVYCLLVALTLQLKFKVLRYFVFTVAALPICLGYILGTSKAGMLGLFFIVGDMVSPGSTEQVGPDLVCEITLWGVAGSSGYDVDLYQLWPRVPFMRRRVVRLSVDEGYVGGQAPVDKTCADALSAYEH
jgi:hypothetical protein